MPIRIEPDDPQSGRRSSQNNNSGGSSGMGGALLKFLPFILMFVFKRPKLLIPILIIGGIWYFFFGGQEMFSGEESSASHPEFSLGAALSETEYDKAEVFEPLAYGSFNQLPARVSLEQYAPSRRHQGQQGSCVGWASAYAARTILQSKATGQSPNSVAFSPAFLYNQIALDGCQGAYMLEAMKTMYQEGALPFNQFSYDDRSCSKSPDGSQLRAAQQYKIKGYNRLSETGEPSSPPDVQAIRQNLAQGAPVVIGMMVGGTFMSRMVGQNLWRPTQSDYSMRGFSGHAMCVIGYDDNMEGGAFQLMNSWGEDWGNRGMAWVRYADFERFTKEAYGLYPMGSANQQAVDQNKLAVEFGLLDVASQKTIALRQAGDLLFKTAQPIRKGDKFKILLANTVECYTYVFGQETDGSSYVLFPYTEKHSPYCGITGTRLFPKDESLKADDIGNSDFMAIVISKTALDAPRFNQRINSSRQRTYAEKLKEALADQRVTSVAFQADKTIAFKADTKGKNAVGMVLQIDKQ